MSNPLIWTRRFPFPHIWRQFKAKDVNSERLVCYRIEDMPEDQYQTAVDMMASHVVDGSEFLTQSLDSEGSEILKSNWAEVTKHKLSLACFKEDHDHPVGVMFLFNCYKSAPPVEIKNKTVKKVVDSVNWCIKKADLYEKYGVESYIGGYGIAIDKDYRRRNIATEMLIARSELTKAVGLSLTAGVFTHSSSQLMAQKAGWEADFSIKYSDLAKAGFKFEGVPQTESMQVMSFFHGTLGY